MLVMLTTLIFGTFMDAVQKFLIPPKGGTKHERNASQATTSMYEEIVHPNEEKSMISDAPSRRPSYLLGAQPASWATSAFVNWFVDFDEMKLRPFLIRNYSLQYVQKQDMFDDAVSLQQLQMKKDQLQNTALTSFLFREENSLIIQDKGPLGVSQGDPYAPRDPKGNQFLHVN